MQLRIRFNAIARAFISNKYAILISFISDSLDKKSNEVKLIADSESRRKVKETEQFEKLAFMLKSTLKDEKKLTFYDDCTLDQNNQQDPIATS